MPKGKGYPKSNPVGKGKTRVTMNPGKPNESSKEFKRGSKPKPKDLGSGGAAKAAKALAERKRKQKKIMNEALGKKKKGK